MEPCQDICAQNAKQFVENGSYQKFIAESQGSAGKSFDLDVESSKVSHVTAKFNRIRLTKEFLFHTTGR